MATDARESMTLGTMAQDRKQRPEGEKPQDWSANWLRREAGGASKRGALTMLSTLGEATATASCIPTHWVALRDRGRGTLRT